MPFAIRQLINRGYWDAKEDDTAANAAGGTEDSVEASDSEGGDDTVKASADTASPDDSDDSSEEYEGKKKISDADAQLLKEVMQKKQTIKELRSEMDAMKKALGQWEGYDPKEIKELVESKKKAETKRLEERGEWDKLKQQMVEQHQNELKSLQERLSELENGLQTKDSVIEKLTVGHNFDNSKYIAEELTLTPNKARIVYGSHFDIEDGQVVGYDKPRGAEGRTQLIDGKGEPLGFEEALKKIIETDPDREQLIRSKAKPGAGSKTITDKAPEEKPKLRGHERIAASLRAGA